MLLDVHKRFYRLVIQENHFSVIVYFAAVAKTNLARKGLRAIRKFRVGSYVI